MIYGVLFLLYKEGTEEIPIKYTQKALLSESDSSAFFGYGVVGVLGRVLICIAAACPHAAEGPRDRPFNGLPRKAGGGVKTPPYGLTFTGAL